ncbi:hypothetical protein COO60DRAFT_1490945 [Scenedesmus sp. NREL 46B-D3]|nr:hypothetical protein COO60DRAFT_1490945 [Scenedesmus sp. NREL 46B-D3]
MRSSWPAEEVSHATVFAVLLCCTATVTVLARQPLTPCQHMRRVGMRWLFVCPQKHLNTGCSKSAGGVHCTAQMPQEPSNTVLWCREFAGKLQCQAH